MRLIPKLSANQFTILASKFIKLSTLNTPCFLPYHERNCFKAERDQIKSTGKYKPGNEPINKPITDQIIEPSHIPKNVPRQELTNERVNN